MKILTRRCKTCGALGVGPSPSPVKLHPFEGALYCARDFKEALEWHEQRGHVTSGLKREEGLRLDAKRRPKRTKAHVMDWRGYIYGMCWTAEFALINNDRRTFVYYFARAMYAWDLKERT